MKLEYEKYTKQLRNIYKKYDTNEEKYIEGVWFLSSLINGGLSEYFFSNLMNYNYFMTNGGKNNDC